MEADNERLTDPRPVKKSGGLKPRDAVLVLGVVLVIGGIGWYIVKDSDAPEQPPMMGDMVVPPEALDRVRDQLNQPQAPQARLTDAELAPVTKPEALDSSDAQVGRALEDISPPLLAWLTPQEQVRKWVSFSVNLADGDLVSKHRPLSYPMKSFKVVRQGDRISMSSANFKRADALIGALTAIPPEKLAAYYRQWTPTLQQAFDELGVDGTFHGHFSRLVDQALAVKTLSRPPALAQPHVLYVYADEELEDASDLSKLMWRLGPDNMTQLQAYLLEFKNSL